VGLKRKELGEIVKVGKAIGDTGRCWGHQQWVVRHSGASSSDNTGSVELDNIIVSPQLPMSATFRFRHFSEVNSVARRLVVES
jgi:hypothetical protein